MDERSSTSNSEEKRRQVPVAGIVCLLLVCFIEWVLPKAGLMSSADDLGDKILASKVLLNEHPTSSADILVLGDSAASTGIDALGLSHSFGDSVKVLNLATVASHGCLVNNLFILRRYLANHRPKAVFLILSSRSLNAPDWKVRRNQNTARYFHRSDELPVYAHLMGAEATARALHYRLFPSTRWRRFFREYPSSNFVTYSDVRRRAEDNQSFASATLKHHGYTPVTESEDYWRGPRGVEIKPFSKVMLEQIVEELEEKKIPLYFQFAPMPESVYRATHNAPRKRQTFADIRSYLEDRGVRELPLPAFVPDHCFGSGYHLKESEVPVLTERLKLDWLPIVEGVNHSR